MDRSGSRASDEMISFVVIAYNEEENIASTLTAIMALDELGDHEILVIDDGSTDKTAEIVQAIAAQNSSVRFIALGRNYGRGYARWRGISAARGSLLATVDADIVLPSHWLTRTYEAMQTYDAAGGTAVPDADASYVYKNFNLAPRAVGHTNVVSGSNALYRRSVFDRVQFDRRLRDGEDSVLNYDIMRAGMSCVTVPGLIVSHEENKSFRNSLKWLFTVGRGATRQLFHLRKVRVPDLAAFVFVGALLLGILIAIDVNLLLGAVLPVVFVLVTSIQHIRSRFYAPRARWASILPAIAVDCVLLTTYFLGRIVGAASILQSASTRESPTISMRWPSATTSDDHPTAVEEIKP